MSEPTPLVISEQARATADEVLQIAIFKTKENQHTVLDRMSEQIQLLLNSQREAIIRECADEARASLYSEGRSSEGRFAHKAILAKLQNK